MVIVTIDSDFLSGKLCMEKAIRTITINNPGSIVDTTDMAGNKVKKLELTVLLPDSITITTRLFPTRHTL